MNSFQSKIIVLLQLAVSGMAVQVTPQQRLHDSLLLAEQSRFDEVAERTKALIASGQLSGADLGHAWLLLGFAYKERGQFGPAQRAVDESLRVLGSSPQFLQDYAAALEYEGSLYQEEGQLDGAARVLEDALKIFEQAGDHAASGGAYRNLAELELQRGNVRQARKFFENAVSDADAAGGLTAEARAAYALTEGWLDLEEKRFPEAVSAYERSLEFCRIASGENSYTTGWGLVLLANALAHQGQVGRALVDMQRGLSILKASVGPDNPKYLVAEIAYASALRRAGSRSEAAALKKRAEQAMKELYGRQCMNCTISVSALR